MSLDDTLLHHWFEEVWNRGREDAIDEIFAADGIAHGLSEDPAAPVRGTAAFREFYRKFHTAFPDIRITVEDCIAVGDRIAARCSVSATHTGSGILPSPTGTPVSFTGMCIARIKDGKIIEAWNNFDFLALYQQLGMKLT